jgi:hypothetical protein
MALEAAAERGRYCDGPCALSGEQAVVNGLRKFAEVHLLALTHVADEDRLPSCGCLSQKITSHR